MFGRFARGSAVLAVVALLCALLVSSAPAVSAETAGGGTTTARVNAGRIDVGNEFACSVFSTGIATCWGSNDFGGELGSGTGVDSPFPVEVFGVDSAASISAGDSHGCALLRDATLTCWGDNGSGGLGNNSTTDSLVPVVVSGISTAAAVSAGNDFSCAPLTSGAVQCWGSNGSGELGDGNAPTDSPVPVAVSGISTALAVSAGDSHACALLGSGAVQCWGDNAGGQLGDGNAPTDSAVPVAVTGISAAIAISAGSDHTCALLASGAVQCWGDNGSGALGNNSTTDSSVPVAVSGISTAIGVSAGDSFSCAVLSTGSASCWGDNANGELGNGAAPTDSSVPVAVSGISTAVAIGAGDVSACALLASGGVLCWGANNSGQLGNNNAPTDSSVPVGVVGVGGTGVLNLLPMCGGKVATISGDTGTPLIDVILGTTASEYFNALAGDDTICGDSADQGAFAGPGNDTVFVEFDSTTTGVAGQSFYGDGPSGDAGNDRLVVRAGSIIDGEVAGDGQSSGPGGNDTILFAGMLTGQLNGDSVNGDGGDDAVAVLPAGTAENVFGDAADGNGGRDTITIVGTAGSVRGDRVDLNGGNDTIAITRGSFVKNLDALFPRQGWVVGDGANGNGGNDFMILRGTIEFGVMGDAALGAGGKDFMRIYPAAVINGPVLGDGAFSSTDPFGRVGGLGGPDTIVAFANATINSSVIGDAAALGGGNDRMSLGAKISGDVIGDDVTAGPGGNDSIGLGGAAVLQGNLVGDQASGKGGNDILDVSGTVVGTIIGDDVLGAGGNDIIFIRATAVVANIFGDLAGKGGGDDTIVINKGAQVNGAILGDNSTGSGGDDKIVVSGTVTGNIDADSSGGIGGADRITINPAGVVNGNIIANRGTNTIIVMGTVNGGVTCSPTSTLTILGAGTITGDTSTC